MSEISDAFLARARESLAGAASELINGRYNNTANRSSDACFQAAIAALDLAGIRPSDGKSEWGHAFVQGQFAGALVNRRKLFPPALRDVLAQTFALRAQGDDKLAGVSQAQASRALTRARAFVDAVAAQGGRIE